MKYTYLASLQYYYSKTTAKSILAACFIFFTFQVHAQTDTTKNNSLVLKYSALDLPFAIRAAKTVNSSVSNPDAEISLIKGMSYFSMTQSLELSANVTNSIGYGLTKIPILLKKPIVKQIFENLLALPTYYILRLAPYGPTGWIHEEWHRSVMVHSYTNSDNPLSSIQLKFRVLKIYMPLLVC